jgi:hypothetical protein
MSDNEVYQWTKLDSEIGMAHEILAHNLLYDAIFRCSVLSVSTILLLKLCVPDGFVVGHVGIKLDLLRGAIV